MGEKLFAGIADNSYFATAVVGDSQGRIVTTSVGESVNFRFCGMSQARKNLRKLIAKTVGWRERNDLAGVCFTYKTDLVNNDLEMLALVHGLLQDIEIKVEKFSASCTLGICTERDRLVLIGGYSRFALFEDHSGLRFCLRRNSLTWNSKLRLLEKIGGESGSYHREEPGGAPWRPANLIHLCRALDRQADCGNPLALEIACDIAHELVELVVMMAANITGKESVIGLYGPVLLGSRVVFERVCRIISLLFPEVRLKKAALAPAKGAYLSTLLTRNSVLEEELISNLAATSNDLLQNRWLSPEEFHFA